MALPDPVAMAVALDPRVCTESSEHRVEIETHSELTRGMTVVDKLNVAGDERNRGVWSSGSVKNKVRVCWAIDVPRWKGMLMEAMR
jgi:purine nucleosidase